MNVASLKLCRELHELSGWKDTEYTYYANAGLHSGFVEHRRMVFDKPDNLPAYDLGYLLRKLPASIAKRNQIMLLTIMKGNGIDETWIVDYKSAHEPTWLHEGDKAQLTEADTPEDAAAKLA